MSPDAQLPALAPPAGDARDLAARTEAVRRRHARVALATGLAIALVIVLAWLTAECFLDWLFELPWLVRAAGLLAGAGGAAWLAWRGGLRAWRQRLDDDAVALMIERALPAFRSRFIAAVQLARGDSGATSLVRALVAETSALSATLSFAEVVRTDRLRRWLQAAGTASVVAGGLALLGGPNTLPLLTRALLWNNPVPRKTQIETSGDRTVAVGDDVEIRATARGLVPAGGRLLLETASGRKQEFTFDAVSGERAAFARVLRSVQESFTFRIALGDAQTLRVRVTVRPRPAVASLECTQHFPAYTGLPPRPRALGDLKILAGSRLALRAKSTRPVTAGSIRLLGDDGETPVQTAPLAVDAQDPTLLRGEIAIPAKGAAGLSLQLADADGIASRGGAVHRLDIVQDQPPTVRLLLPERREELLTRDATMLIAFEAADDFGIARVRLHYAVDFVEGAPHQTIELDAGAAAPRSLARRYDWKISRITPRPEEGQTIDYWLEVFDANDVTGPGTTALEPSQARIVSELEKRADLANRLSDTMEGLNEVKQGQEAVSRALGEIIFEKPPASP